MAELKIRGFSRRGFRVGNQRVSYNHEATVDADNQHIQRRLLANAGAYYSPSAMIYPLVVAGTLTAASTGLTLVAPRDLVISNVVATVGTAPGDADDIIFDIHKVAAGGLTTDAGTSIFTAPPTIAVGATMSEDVELAVDDWNQGDILRLEIDQIGETAAGADLRVYVYAS